MVQEVAVSDVLLEARGKVTRFDALRPGGVG